MRIFAKKPVTMALLGLLIVFVISFSITTLPAIIKLRQDQRNNTVNVLAYQRMIVQPNHLVIDVWGIEAEANRIDVTRSLFQIAERFV